MSERLNSPVDPDQTLPGVQLSLLSVLALLRQVFFPPRGPGLHERVARLEARVRALEDRNAP